MKKMIMQFIKFGLVGGLNTLISCGIFFVLRYFNVNEIIANVTAFIICTAIANILQIKFVFKGKKQKASWKVIMSYIVYGTNNGLIETALIWFFINKCNFPYFIVKDFFAKVIPMFYTIPSNFLLHKYWVYKETKDINGDERNEICSQ